MLGGSILALALFIFGFLTIPCLVAKTYAAETVSAGVTWSTISLTLDPHGDIDFGEVIPSVRDTSIGNYGTQKVVKKQVEVTTEGNYYAVYLSTPTDDNTLKTSAVATQTIPAISTSVTTGFASTSWGYAVPTTETSVTLSAYDSYLASATDVTANNLTKTGVGAAVYNTGSWSPVKTSANIERIYYNSTNAAAGFSSGDTFDIYYSIMVDTDALSGVYENKVVYTALASTASLDTTSFNIARDNASATAGSTETLLLDLASSNNSIAASDVEVYLVPHATIIANSYSIDNLTKTDFPTCSVTSVASSGQSVTILCALPSLGSTGSTDASGNNTVATLGEYDFWVQVATPAKETLNYLSHYRDSNNDIASFVFACSASKICYAGNGADSGTMSDKTASSNSNAMLNTPSFIRSGYAFTGWSTTADDTSGSLYGPNETIATGDLSTEGLQLYAHWLASSGTMQSFTTAQCSAMSTHDVIALTDSRDNNTYSVAKLKDGNCWMTSNLALNLADFAGTHNLTPENTDLNSKTSWNPGANTGSQPSPGYEYNTNLYAPSWVYDWYAVTAGSGTSTMLSPATAPDSICPSGWQLPRVGSSTDKSWAKLLNSYSLTQSLDSILAVSRFPLNIVHYSQYNFSTPYNTNLPAPYDRDRNTFFLLYTDSVIYVRDDYGYNRASRAYTRCVKK